MSFAERHKRWLLPTLGAALAGVVWLNLPARDPDLAREAQPPASAPVTSAPVSRPAGPGADGDEQEDPVPGKVPDLAPPAGVDNDNLPLLLAGRQPITALRAAPRPPVLHPERWKDLCQPPAAPAQPSSARPPRALDFILVAGPRREAWLDGRAYREGDTLEGGYVLRRITPMGVLLSGPAGEATLPLNYRGTRSPGAPGGPP